MTALGRSATVIFDDHDRLGEPDLGLLGDLQRVMDLDSEIPEMCSCTFALLWEVSCGWRD